MPFVPFEAPLHLDERDDASCEGQDSGEKAQGCVSQLLMAPVVLHVALRDNLAQRNHRPGSPHYNPVCVPRRLTRRNLTAIDGAAALRIQSHLHDSSLVLVVLDGKRFGLIVRPANVHGLVERDHIGIALLRSERPVRSEDRICVV